jgi:ABC-2 type transport system ATP-binding protein
MDNIIETHQLKKLFQVRQSKEHQSQIIEAVKGIDLVVRAGEIFGFLGPNGAGKTTTLRMVATLIPPSSGQAKIAGYDLARESRQIR